MWSNEFIKIPFQEHGRSEKGADCWGLICVVFLKKLGISLPSLLNYKDCKDRMMIPLIIMKEASNWYEVQQGEEKPYDVLVFKILGVPMHVGLVVSKGIMLHCEKGSGTYITEYYREIDWFKRLVGIYRYAESQDSPTSV